MWPWSKQVATISAQVPPDLSEGEAMGPGLADAFPDPCLLLARNGQVLHANPDATAIFGPVGGQHVSAAIRVPAVLEAVSRVLQGQGPEKLEFERRGAVNQVYECWIAPVALAQAAGPAAMLVLKDLTRAQLVERMRADFVANASHELRTPLTALLGFIETLQGAARTDEAARAKFLDLMRQQGLRMKRLIDDLLSLSRIEMNAHQQPETRVELASLCRHVADSLAPIAAENGVELSLDLTLGLAVRADRDELVQVLQNLVENALKYAASGKRVELSARRAGAFAELEVRDHGKGIAPEHLPRLTERFYRVDVQESRARGGTGLGLAIAKHIINRHRGELRIRSTLGEGSAFTVVLPAAESVENPS